MVKDDDEVALLRRAAQGADRVVDAIAAGPLVGRTEADVAREVRDRLDRRGPRDRLVLDRRLGAEQRVAPPRGRRPGHPGGEPVVIDIGGTVGGYGSDITRTIWVAGPEGIGPDDEFRRLYEVLRDAQQAATEAVRPGIACEAIDAVARDRITAAGYGPRFIHRTGHGIGLEGHEEPYLVAGQHGAAGARAWRSAWSPASTSRAGTGRGSRTSSSAGTTGRSSSTSWVASCGSCPGRSPAPGVAQGYHPPIGRAPADTKAQLMTTLPARASDPRVTNR